MRSIMDPGGDGLDRVKRLSRNSKYFRRKLQQMGFIVYGHDDSPVIPLMLFMPAKIGGLVRGCMEHNVATVGKDNIITRGKSLLESLFFPTDSHP